VDKLLYWLDKIQAQDCPLVGDKAFNLSILMQRGYPIVPGFVVGANVLREFLDSLDNSEALVADLPHSSLHLDVGNWRQLQQVATSLSQEIISATIPEEWVRAIFVEARKLECNSLIFRPTLTLPSTSGNISGLFNGISCRCEEEEIALALKRTWSQFFRARSLLYWQHFAFDLRKINFAVLVQPLRDAVASGFLNANASVFEIQASWGLGMSINAGEVLPDVYYIQRQTGVLLEQHLGNKIIGYRLKNTNQQNTNQQNTNQISQEGTSNSVDVLDKSCVVAYLMEDAQQHQYALQEEYLQQLITIANQLVSQLGRNFTLDWTITQEGKIAKIYFTKVSHSLSVSQNLHCIKGVGASTGCITANAYVISNPRIKPEEVPQGAILVVPFVAPGWLAILRNVSGIITEQGGLTSHAAILARELGIPAVVNAPKVTSLIQSGEQLLMDGDKGEIYRIGMSILEEDDEKEIPNSSHLSPSSLPHPKSPAPHPKSPAPHSPLPIPHSPITATELLLNLSQASLIEPTASLPVDGVGLLRAEMMMLEILAGQHPSNWIAQQRTQELQQLWFKEITKFARGFAPRPVFYRSLDWRVNEFLPSDDTLSSGLESYEGERGTWSYMQNPAVFELELKAFKAVQQAGYRNLNLILPFVRTIEEFRFCRRKVEEFGLTQVPQFQLWIMAEVPSVLFLLPEYIKAGVQGISIGTNDLTQLLLGVDRKQGQLTNGFQEAHPVVMDAIAQLIKMARNAGIPCSICGQAPSLYPKMIDKLVQWGISSISVEPEAFDRTYRAIARAEQRIILEAARRGE
jgi:pyruvate,water dikinase